MYFKESDLIANEHQYPPSDIQRIDWFLALKYSSNFTLTDVVDKTGVNANAKQIVDEYIGLRVLKEIKRYFCPEHENNPRVLKVSGSFCKKGYCEKCDTHYPLLGLETETIYNRIKPPSHWSDSEKEQSLTHLQTELQTENRRDKIVGWTLNAIKYPLERAYKLALDKLIGLVFGLIFMGVGGITFHSCRNEGSTVDVTPAAFVVTEPAPFSKRPTFPTQPVQLPSTSEVATGTHPPDSTS